MLAVYGVNWDSHYIVNSALQYQQVGVLDNSTSLLLPFILSFFPYAVMYYVLYLLCFIAALVGILCVYRITSNFTLTVLYASMNYYFWFGGYLEMVYMGLLLLAIHFYIRRQYSMVGLCGFFLMLLRPQLGVGLLAALILALAGGKQCKVGVSTAAALIFVGGVLAFIFNLHTPVTNLMWSVTPDVALNLHPTPDLTGKVVAFMRTFRLFIFSEIPKSLLFTSFLIPPVVFNYRRNWFLLTIVLTSITVYSLFFAVHRYAIVSHILVLALMNKEDK